MDFDWICRGRSIAGVWYWMKKTETAKEVQDKGRVVIPLRDMVQLANINTAMDVRLSDAGV